MKKFFVSALLVAGMLTSSNCFAALDYSYNRTEKIFTVKSEEIIPLEDGANELTIAFTKEYDFSGKKAQSGKPVKPTMHVRMMVEGKVQYEFATNANYWQEHNYTYEEMGILKEREAKRLAEEKAKKEAKEKKKDNKAATTVKEETTVEPEAADVNNGVVASPVEDKAELEQRKLDRNPSTLIYLKVENKLSQENKAKNLYDFDNPVAAKEQLALEKANAQQAKDYKPNISTDYEAPDAALGSDEAKGISSDEKNLVELELAAAEAKQKALEEEKEKELLAQLQAENSPEADKLREKIAAREAAKKLAAVDANEERINREVAERMVRVEEVKAARAAFNKYLEEQKAATEGMVYVSTAEAKIPKGDNFWNKIIDSKKKHIPMFFEAKFWKGGANQRIWLKTEKLTELEELIAYDLYKDEANLHYINK